MAEIIKCVACTRTLEQLSPNWYSRSCCPSEGQATVCSDCSYGCNDIWLCCHCWNPTTVIQSPFNAQASLNALNSNPKNKGSYHRGHELLGVINFEPKQIANFTSEFLLTGFADTDGNIIISTVEKPTPNGSKLI